MLFDTEQNIYNTTFTQGKKAKTIAIVGAGASGVALAYQLYQQCTQPATILLFSDETPGLGKAYQTDQPCHLLNVPAHGMSLTPDDPLHFVNWLTKQPFAKEAQSPESRPLAECFVPRYFYGKYLQATLTELCQKPNSHGVQVKVIQDRVIAAKQAHNTWELPCASGKRLVADKLVLAMGNYPNRPIHQQLAPLIGTSHYIHEPWQAGTLQNIAPNERVLILGTGLTMVDHLLSLLTSNHQGEIHVLSRTGLWPIDHSYPKTKPLPWPKETVTLSLVQLMKAIHAKVQQAEDWRAVIDGLRPLTQSLWQRFSLKDKARFLQRLRPFWDIHRHRIAPEVHAILAEKLTSGQVQRHAGKIISINQTPAGINHLYRSKQKDEVVALQVDRIINATGLTSNITQIEDPFIQNLLAQRLIKPDPFNLGIDLADTFTVKNTLPHHQKIYALGPITKGALWEIVAMGDIRLQAQALARHLQTALAH